MADEDDEEMLAMLIADVEEDEMMDGSASTAAVPPAAPSRPQERKIQKRTGSDLVAKMKEKHATTKRKGPEAGSSAVPKPQKPKPFAKFKAERSDDFMCKHSQLRIKNRIIGTLDMDDHMKGRTTYLIPKLANIPQWKLEDETQDWVTFGVLMHKSPSKQASNGGTFMIWKLSGANYLHPQKTE